MARLELKNLSKVYQSRKGEEIYALTNLDLQVAEGELLVLVGPSGSGKSTTLRLIAGLEKPTTGTVFIDEIDLSEVRPGDRDVAMVFQRDALYPHLTVFENMAFGLQLRRMPEAEVATRVRAAAQALNLSACLDRYPRALSGGQRQRVALGRAAVRQPKVFLFDEPLSNLDAPLRMQMRAEIVRLHRRAPAATVYVTHDQAEAMSLGQRIAILRDGALQQVADPHTLYERPANLFVAGFIGSPPMNLIRGRMVPHGSGFVFQENNPSAAEDGWRLEVPLPAERGQRLSHFAEGNVVLGIRPEDVSFSESSGSYALIEMVEQLGAETHLHFHTGAHRLIARVRGHCRCAPGERAPLFFEPARTMFFNPASGAPIV